MSGDLFVQYIAQYGYIGIYGILAVSLLGVPIPAEFLLTFVGFLSYSGKLNPLLTVLVATFGTITGVTVAYLLGTFFERRVLTHLGRNDEKTRFGVVLAWYQRQGGKFLAIGYFIPGVRQLSGYIAGLSRLTYREFALFSYLGAILWCGVFIGLGFLLGSRWKTIWLSMHRYSIWLISGGVLLALVYILYRKQHKRWRNWIKIKFSGVTDKAE